MSASYGAVHRREAGESLWEWRQSVPALGITPQEFYSELSARIHAEEFPEVRIGLVEFGEGGALSPRRTYLRVLRDQLMFDICGAPFGKSAFFVSCRLGTAEPGRLASLAMGLVVALPVVGAVADRLARPLTFYRTDTAEMFRDAVQGIVAGYVAELAGETPPGG